MLAKPEPLPPAPAHAEREDPWKIASALLDEATNRAARRVMAEVLHDLPGALDRLTMRRYGWLLFTGTLGSIGLGGALMYLWFTLSFVCRVSEGWRHCIQWVG